MTGLPKYHEAYRSKITGIFHVVSIIETICKKQILNEGLIPVACYGMEALRKEIDQYKKFSCISNNFDILSSIDQKLNASPIQLKLKHVKGNQDDHIGTL